MEIPDNWGTQEHVLSVMNATGVYPAQERGNVCCNQYGNWFELPKPIGTDIMPPYTPDSKHAAQDLVVSYRV
jgi:hypothetical protein